MRVGLRKQRTGVADESILANAALCSPHPCCRSNLDWSLGRVRSVTAAARALPPASAAQQNAVALRQHWEHAALVRLHKAADVLCEWAGWLVAGMGGRMSDG